MLGIGAFLLGIGAKQQTYVTDVMFTNVHETLSSRVLPRHVIIITALSTVDRRINGTYNESEWRPCNKEEAIVERGAIERTCLPDNTVAIY